MYCPHCGTNVIAGGRYCAHCGKQLAAANVASTLNAAPSQTAATEFLPTEFGTARTVWRKTSVTPRFRNEPNVDLTWTFKQIDVILTDKIVVVVASFPASKVYSAADSASTVAVAAGALGGALLALPLAALAEAYEKVFGESNILERDPLQPLFESGRVLWLPRREATLRCYQIKTGLLGPFANVAVLSGPFRHTIGRIDSCFSFVSDNVVSTFSDIRKGFEKAGFSVEITKIRSMDELERALDKEYPHPNEWKYADANEITWCKNCCHHVPVQQWEDSKKGLWLVPDIPREALIPCGVVTQTIEVWREFFAKPRDQRTLYPKQCPYFKKKMV